VWLLEELGIPYHLYPISISRPDGTGGPDANNPHPLKQVPVIEHDGQVIVESIVVMLHLADQFPAMAMAPALDCPRRAEYMGWMGILTAVLEPIIVAVMRGDALSERQAEARRQIDARIKLALDKHLYLLGEAFSAVDLVYYSYLRLSSDFISNSASFEQWQARIASRPALARARELDAISEPTDVRPGQG
jgi:glutathione S-transferase